jgi:hypothetical protein
VTIKLRPPPGGGSPAKLFQKSSRERTPARGLIHFSGSMGTGDSASTCQFSNYHESILSHYVDVLSGKVMRNSCLLLLASLTVCISANAMGQEAGRRDFTNSTYQRSRWHNQSLEHPRRRHHAGPVIAPQQVQSGWYQRPYPYHLDYYRMRYGGSYEPYFGNLYGPPNVILPQAYPAPYPYYNDVPGPVPNGGIGY